MNRHDTDYWCKVDDLRDGVRQRTREGTRWMAASTVARTAVEGLSILVLARLLTPSAFGVVGMATAVTSFVGLFKDIGLSTATIQKESITPTQLDRLFWINAWVSVFLALVVAALGPFVSLYFETPALTNIFLVLATSFAFEGLSIQHRALLRRKMLFRKVAIAELGQTVGSLLVAMLLAWAGWGYWALVSKMVALSMLSFVLHWVLCDYRPGVPDGFRGVGEFLHAGKNLTGFSFFNYFARNLDDILVGKYAGAQSLGLYQKAYEMLMMPLGIISRPTAAVAIPALSRVTAHPEEYRQTYESLASRVLALSVLLGAILLTAPEAILTVMLGEKWAPAAEIFFWMGWLTFTQPVGNSTGWLYISQDRTAQMMRWGLLGASLAVTSFFVGLPFGAVGVAAAYSISGVLVRTPLCIYYATRSGPVGAGYLVRVTLPFQLVGVASWGVGWLGLRMLALESSLLQMGSAILICTATMVLGLLCFPSGRAVLSEQSRVRPPTAI